MKQLKYCAAAMLALAGAAMATPADDAREVQNLMGLRAIYQARGDNDAWIDLYAQEPQNAASDSFLIMGMTMKGLDNVKKMFNYGKASPPGMGGGFTEHALLSNIIEVAADGKTAKGFWQSFGPLVFVRGGNPSGTFAWENYGVDFIKENGKWKIWHIAVFTDLTVGIGETIADKLNPKPAPAGGPPPGGRPMPPNPYPEWSPTRATPNYPLPVPYRTFSETFSYGDLTK